MQWLRKLFLNIGARFALPAFMFNNHSDPELDKLFWAVCQAEITNICIGRHEMSFDACGLEFREIWNANRWYAWLSEGTIKRNGKTVYQWSNARPSAYVMLKFRQHLWNFTVNSRAGVEGILYEAAVENLDC